MARNSFRVEQMEPNNRLAADLEYRLSATCEQAPILVILDVDSVEAGGELLARRIVKQQDGCAVRCVVTRAEFDEYVARRLRELEGSVSTELGDPTSAVLATPPASAMRRG